MALNRKKWNMRELFPFSLRDLMVTLVILVAATCLCIALQSVQTIDAFALPVYILAVFLVSLVTRGYLFGLLASGMSVVCVNYAFTYPYFSINFLIPGYPLTFLTFLLVAIITGALSSKIRQQEILRAENEKVKMRANLLRSVSHDIRTPLTAIIGATSAVLENPSLSKEEQRALLEDVRSEAQWLIRIVENLLSITRMGNSQMQLSKQLEVAEEVLSETARKSHKQFPGISISVRVPEEMLLVPMDPILIGQVLFNLVENAATHGERTSEIHISVEKEKNEAAFYVRDNGVGIPPEQLPRLFDGTLKHAETVHGDGKRNMGLGLSVCKAIILAHNGTISARNREVGAEVCFRLPLS